MYKHSVAVYSAPMFTYTNMIWAKNNRIVTVVYTGDEGLVDDNGTRLTMPAEDARSYFTQAIQRHAAAPEDVKPSARQIETIKGMIQDRPGPVAAKTAMTVQHPQLGALHAAMLIKELYRVRPAASKNPVHV